MQNFTQVVRRHAKLILLIALAITAIQHHMIPWSICSDLYFEGHLALVIAPPLIALSYTIRNTLCICKIAKTSTRSSDQMVILLCNNKKKREHIASMFRRIHLQIEQMQCSYTSEVVCWSYRSAPPTGRRWSLCCRPWCMRRWCPSRRRRSCRATKRLCLHPSWHCW